MLRCFRKREKVNTTQVVDEIEAAVYAHLKPLGFKKHGRTLHRFVSGDISQVIHFQSGMPSDGMTGQLCVNLGIRVPECEQRLFKPQEAGKKYFHEYECTMRSRLGTVSGKKETWFDLSGKRDKIIRKILEEIDTYVLPAYEVLNSREGILAHRREYPLLDDMSGSILLDECMIYRAMDNLPKARELFERYYRAAVAEYEKNMTQGRREYLKKGERVIYMGQDITATKSGYVTLYGASHGHIDYLDELAAKLDLR